MRCYLEQQHQGHQQLVTCMNVVGNTVLTGSQDHTLKVIKSLVIVNHIVNHLLTDIHYSFHVTGF